MFLMTRLLCAWVALSSSAVVMAHPGHGLTDPQTLTHQIAEPVHASFWLLLIGIGVTLAATATWLWKRRDVDSSRVRVRRQARVERD